LVGRLSLDADADDAEADPLDDGRLPLAAVLLLRLRVDREAGPFRERLEEEGRLLEEGRPPRAAAGFEADGPGAALAAARRADRRFTGAEARGILIATMLFGSQFSWVQFNCSINSSRLLWPQT